VRSHIGFHEVKINGGLKVVKGGKLRGLESKKKLIGGKNRNYNKVRGQKMSKKEDI